VAICTSSPRATTTGNQPPSGIFGMLAEKKARSTPRRGATTRPAFAVDHPHRCRTTT
jgi:hypothetical protein